MFQVNIKAVWLVKWLAGAAKSGTSVQVTEKTCRNRKCSTVDSGDIPQHRSLNFSPIHLKCEQDYHDSPKIFF